MLVSPLSWSEGGGATGVSLSGLRNFVSVGIAGRESAELDLTFSVAVLAGAFLDEVLVGLSASFELARALAAALAAPIMLVGRVLVAVAGLLTSAGSGADVGVADARALAAALAAPIMLVGRVLVASVGLLT